MVELLVRLVRWLLNVEQFQHGLKGLKELSMRTSSILICVEISFGKTVMQRS